MKKTAIQKMVLTAIMLALGAVLSMVKIFEMPLGGSITLLSMLPLVMLSVTFGAKWGATAGLFSALLQIGMGLGEVLSWGLTPTVLVGTIVFDYLIAFTVIGLAGVFRKKGIKGILAGTAIMLFLRFISHFISGSILFTAWCPEGWNVVLYSVCYNGAYMLPELIITMMGAVALFKVPAINKLATA